ncbi:SurA N-terminal domain-containing protein, partial [bacterium]|nr:SurA N-terminal domain-containing protein [bacterium]
NAASWMIKVLLGMIVLSFIFFFGYSRISKSAGKGIVASVNGDPIYMSEYQMTLENIFQFYKNLYTDQELPEYLVQSIKHGALRQLIHNRLLNQLADSLGIKVTDLELREEIIKSPIFVRDGKFDKEFYRNTYIPYFKSKYNIDFEKIRRDEIQLTKIRKLFTDGQKTSPLEALQEYQIKNTKWTFESVEIDPQALVNDKVVENTDEVKNIAKELNDTIETWKARSILSKFNLKKNEYTVSINEKSTLNIKNASIDEYLKIFALDSENSKLAEPLYIGGRYYVLLLKKREVAPEDSWQEGSEELSKQLMARNKNEVLEQWLASLAAKASIKSFLPEE